MEKKQTRDKIEYEYDEVARKENIARLCDGWDHTYDKKERKS